MQINKYNDPNEYYQRVESYLLQNEATHCLIIGLSKALCSSPPKQAGFPYLVTVESKGKIIATAIRTASDRRLVLSRSTDLAAIEEIVSNLATLENKSLPGVIGLKAEAIAFARAWQRCVQQDYELAFAMKIHQLETVESVKKTSGSLRLAVAEDRSLLTNWIHAFESEALGDSEPKSDPQRWFTRNLEKKSLYVWQDRELVSMAAFGGATPNGVKINAVYTPLEHRGKGYARSCVAALSQRLLERYKYCFLFTDLANPTSNHIYQKVGYQPVCEISNLSFKPA